MGRGFSRVQSFQPLPVPLATPTRDPCRLRNPCQSLAMGQLEPKTPLKARLHQKNMEKNLEELEGLFVK